MKKKISKEDIYKIIAKLLKTSTTKIVKIDKLNKIENWDSLAQLDILSALDKKLGNQLSDLNDNRVLAFGPYLAIAFVPYS